MFEPAGWTTSDSLESAGHAERVLSRLRNSVGGDRAENEFPYDSWLRCATEYGLAPDGRCDIPRVGEREVRIEQDRLGEKLAVAQIEMDQLDAIIRSSGYVTTLSNPECMIVGGRNYIDPLSPACDARPGTIWNERFGGTNAVGTSIHDRRPTSLRRNEHFFVDHLDESCFNIPLFAPDCTVWASIGISNRDPHLDVATHALAMKIFSASADRLSEEVFRRSFRNNRILKIKSVGSAGAYLLAVDEDGHVAGADRRARRALRLGTDLFAGFSLWDRFAGDRSILSRPTDDQSGAVDLIVIESGEKVRGVAIGAFQRASQIAAHAPRPRATTVAAVVTMDEWAGSDPAMRQEVKTLRRVMDKSLPVILLGETGVGKDTLARAFHAESPRRSKPFVAVNCGAIPESLIESELFGYDGGAFTGARKAGAPGRLRQAHEGTLFLDEIGEMPLHLQTRLLRAIESGEVYPLGSADPHIVDVQVIAATNRDLEAKVAAGTFRDDLYYRLAGIVVHIPALRERRDMAEMIDTLARKTLGAQGLTLSPAARAALLGHSWPGNLRELARVIERAACIASADMIEPCDLRLSSMANPARRMPGCGDAASRPMEKPASAHDDDPDYRSLVTAIDHGGSDIDSLVRCLGLSRATLYRRLKKYGLSRAVHGAR